MTANYYKTAHISHAQILEQMITMYLGLYHTIIGFLTILLDNKQRNTTIRVTIMVLNKYKDSWNTMTNLSDLIKCRL